MDGRTFKEFLSLPVNPDEIWQGGVATLADLTGIPAAEAPSRIGLILWRGVPSELIHAQPVMADADDAFDQFVDAMLELSERHEFPYRPAQIDCNDRQFADALNRRLAESGTVVHYRAKMGDWTTVVRELAEHVQSVASPSLPSLPSLREAGCSDDQLREYAAAAAEFYRAKLWEVLDDADLIKIETPRPPRLMKHAVVLGAGAQSYGLGFYQDDEDHYGLMAQEIDPRQMSLFSFVYESPADAASEDVELWKELDLPLETGEAFPDANLFLPAGPRRPTPIEIDFLTIVLRGLAQTSEEELDSRCWTKWIQLSGKRRKCAFSIPNLVDPPDRAEWIRRGKMPDRRSHEIHFRRVQEFIDSVGGDLDIDELNEAINAQFTGRRLDDFELPRNTPAERAEALYQDALGCFGRRRVLLAREALTKDPNHIEAAILVAESTRAVDARIEMFRNAKQSAATALGKDMEELAGQFWGFHETRPFMRACEGLAVALADAGQLSDAIEQYREMLTLNPNDNQGVRYELVPLLIEQDRDAEAVEVLDQYPEGSALWLYMKALVEFRGGGSSPKAKKAIRAAFKGNDHVMKLLLSDEPPMMPEAYALGSPEEAAICLQHLRPAWEETDRFLEWMFQEYFAWERERAERLRDRRRKQNAKKSKRKRRR
ncbi:MAG: tetratricopeptide repeat protein [Pirellulales bacterium]|nr:tetratricopeptide repeat protein [Pirellulales bacterium]